MPELTTCDVIWWAESSEEEEETEGSSFPGLCSLLQLLVDFRLKNKTKQPNVFLSCCADLKFILPILILSNQLKEMCSHTFFIINQLLSQLKSKPLQIISQFNHPLFDIIMYPKTICVIRRPVFWRARESTTTPSSGPGCGG